MPDRGFILTASYRIEAGRPVVELAGRLEDGAHFLVRDGRSRPYFFVPAEHAGRVASLGAVRVTACEARGLDGSAVARVEVDVPGAVPPLRERLAALGVRCYEADVRFATRYLIRRGIRGSCVITGPWHPGPHGCRVWEQPELEPADWAPELEVLALDIETDPRAQRLLSVALHGCGASEVMLIGRPEQAPPRARAHQNERSLLEDLQRRVRELDPDVLTGWNVVDFDLSVLARIADRCGVRLALGRGDDALRLRPARGARRSLEAYVRGRAVLDGIDLLRGAFVKMEEYSLDFVAREVLGAGKTLAGRGRAQQILDLYHDDPERFVEYNQNDARLALDIIDRLGLVRLALERSRLTGMPLDRVSASIASFDFLYLTELGRRGRVAPSVGGSAGAGEANLGGHVLEPRPGLHEDVLAFDFKSLYPTVIRTFQIDPLGYLPRVAPGDDPIIAPNGAAFRRDPGILPGLLDELMPRREAARARGDGVASHAIKILMNSFYGVLGTPACRFYEPAVAGAITAFGRELLLWSKRWLEEQGLEVLYGDTDSLFALPERAGQLPPEQLGARLAADLNRALAGYVADRWRVESRLELRFERVYRRLLLLPTRHGRAGARKRYAGLVGRGVEERVVFVGMESVRSDCTTVAREVERELYARLFRDQPVEGYLRGVVAELRGGRRDEQLVYRKALRKPLAAYTATTPPHVAAARKPGGVSRGRISYVVTLEGPEPAAQRRSPIDHEHYVQKQLRPIAEPVLALLGLDFDRVVGDDTQLRLFP